MAANRTVVCSSHKRIGLKTNDGESSSSFNDKQKEILKIGPVGVKHVRGVTSSESFPVCVACFRCLLMKSTEC